MPIFVIDKMALVGSATITVAVALLVVRLGTIFVAEAVTVSAMLVPDAVPAFDCRTKVKLAVALTARLLPSVQVIVPVPPTGGTVPHVQPTGGVMDWKVVLGGVFCVKLADRAAAGPLLVTVIV